MLKKILAASSAAVVAVSALASTTAMAAGDDYTIVIENVNDYKMVTLDLSASLSANQIKELLGGNKTITNITDTDEVTCANYDNTTDAENSYANMVLSVWMQNFTGLQGYNEKDEKADRNDGKSGKYTWEDVEFKGATISVDLEAEVQPKYVIKAGYELPAGGDWIPEDFAEAHPDENYPIGGNGMIVDRGTKGGAPGYAFKNGQLVTEEGSTTVLKEDPKNKVTGTNQVSFTKEATISKSAKWEDFNSKDNPSINGKVVRPASIKGTFGLNNENWLEDLLYNKSSVKVDFTVSMPEYAYYGMIHGTEAGDYYWDWDDKCWKDPAGNKVTNFKDILNGGAAKDAINDYFGIVGQSWGKDSNKVYGGVNGIVEIGVKNVVAEDVHKVNPLALDRWYWVALGYNSTPTRLKNMNNGGTIEFVFKNDVWGGSFLSVEAILRSGSGVAAVPLHSGFAFAESGKSVSMEFPAGLTGSGLGSGETNPFNSIYIDYVIKGTDAEYDWGAHGGRPVVGDDPTKWGGDYNNDPTQWGNELVQIVIHCNKEAPKDETSKPDSSSSNSGGLVEKPDSTPSTSTPSTSTPSTNNGGTSNNEKNPGTGVAVAIAPVVLATAAAAVVISKKRK